MQQFRPTQNSATPSTHVVLCGNARFSVLTDRLIRCEYSSDGTFEDRASQHIWNRDGDPNASFSTRLEDGRLTIETRHLLLTYQEGTPFSEALQITMKAGAVATASAPATAYIHWTLDRVDEQNLRGTYRTLDNCKGNINMYVSKEIELSQGLLSRSGWSIIDDTKTLLFGDDGFLHARQPACVYDLYFLGYGQDYKGCLRDYYKIAGQVPLIPKWVLGLWWSRWENYNQDDVLQNVAEFEAHGAPLSNHVIDMDWHVVDNPYNNGWTGYTWNDASFPDPVALFQALHQNGVHACLNLHPAGGVYPHEARYEEFAKFMGVDPAAKEPIAFDISDPKFIEAYFTILHHPLEDEGVDFWWIDWQQEQTSKMQGLDPLWFLNHLHSLDLKRDGKKRPLTFSRWGDHGSHRYPIGFSGDTYATWETLQFLPYFTATAANIGYGWWSHDVAGFARGAYNDAELYLRWVQFATFSPVFRFHNCGDPLINNKPWSKPAEIEKATIQALKLRRALAPYLYTAAWKNHLGDAPLCRPMYHDFPQNEAAYCFESQFMCGDHILVAPYLTPKDSETGLSRSVFWLPEGGWYHLQNGTFYEDPGFYSSYGDVGDWNVFVKAGTVLPMVREGKTRIVVFPGNGCGALYEDDGESMAYAQGEFSHATFTQTYSDGLVTVHADMSVWDYVLVSDDWDLERFLNEEIVATRVLVEVPASQNKFSYKLDKAAFLSLLSHFDLTGHNIRPFMDHFEQLEGDINYLKNHVVDLSENQLRCLLETLTGCGFASMRMQDGSDVLLAWNHEELDAFSVGVSERLQYSYQHTVLAGENALLKINNTSKFTGWKAIVSYRDLFHYTKERVPN